MHVAQAQASMYYSIIIFFFFKDYLSCTDHIGYEKRKLRKIKENVKGCSTSIGLGTIFRNIFMGKW